MDGVRSALIVATYDYDDDGLTQLRAPQHDAEALSDVLGDPAIGGFDVQLVLNRPSHKVDLAVARFFADRRAEDTLLLHFSCHGVKDESGELYLAARDTRLDTLAPTATSASSIRRCMDTTRAGRVVLLLDCCYAGAFGRGMRARSGGAVDLGDRFGGKGTAIIAASSALEFAFEEGTLTAGGPGATQPSVFTGAVVRGLRTGDADRDQDGWVSLDELYTYVHREVSARNPHQNPRKWAMDVQGDLYIARRGSPVTTPSELPAEIKRSLGSYAYWERKGAVELLSELRRGDHPGLALAAHHALLRLATDPDDRVKAAASEALGVTPPAIPAPRRIATPAAPVREEAAASSFMEPRAPVEDQEATRVLPSPRERPTAPKHAQWRPRPWRPWVLAGGSAVAAFATVLLLFLPDLSPEDPGGTSPSVPRETAEEGPQTGPSSPSPSPQEKAWTLGRKDILLAEGKPRNATRIVAIHATTGRKRVILKGLALKWPNPSRDRSAIAYAIQQDDGLNVPYIMTSSESSGHRLLSEAAREECPYTGRPAWSPDDRQLALVCLDRNGESTKIMIVDTDGNAIHDVLRSRDLLHHLTWDPSDDTIYFSQDVRGGKAVLHSVSPSGTGPQRASRDDRWNEVHPDASQRRVAYVRRETMVGGDADAFLRTASGEVKPLTSTGNVDSVALSRNGKSMAWVTKDGDSHQLWVAELGGAQREPLLDSERVLGPPSWGSR